MYEAKDYSHLIGTPGFSEKLLNDHFGLYKGYVTRTNALLEKLSGTQSGTPELNEMKRRFGWEWNGMRLHELYFGNMTKDKKKLDDGSPLKKRFADAFGADKFIDNFTQSALLPGIGWVVTYLDPKSGLMQNVWVAEHGENHLSGCTPLLVMDMWEHAYIGDYGTKKADYVTAFMDSIDWEEVEKRYEEAIKK